MVDVDGSRLLVDCMSYQIAQFSTTLSDLQGHSHIYCKFFNVTFRTVVQQLTTFQLIQSMRGPSAMAELVVYHATP